MTVIAFRNGIMASDSQITDCGLKCTGLKLTKRNDTLIGVCGSLESGLAFSDWYFDRESRRPELAHEDFGALVYTEQDGLQFWSQILRPVKVLEPYYAIGSGSHVAMGAFDMGASAKRAVMAACKWADGCGLPVVAISLKR